MNSSPARNITLTELKGGLPGLSEVWGRFLSEASAVCFEYHKHPKGVELTVQGFHPTTFKVYWEGEITEQVYKGWSDEQELVEFGACGVAILLMLELTGYTVIRRARKGTGVDYWLCHKNAEIPFQDAARLEVSGIFNGTDSDIKTRVNKKKQQIQQSDDTLLPAYVIVVEFSKPKSYLVQK